MSSAGLNQEDSKIRRLIVCSIIQQMKNKLEKGEKPGEATIAQENGEIEVLQDDVPIIDAEAQTHNVVIDDENKEAFRIINKNGKNFKVRMNYYKSTKIKHADWKKREGIENKDKGQDIRE